MSTLLKRGWRAFDAIVLWRGRRRCRLVIDNGAPRVAETLYRAATWFANLPFKSAEFALPAPTASGDATIDVVNDLSAFTALPRNLVERELATRANASFRAEWYATPRALREDHWFYLSAKGYLFGNAVHFPDTTFVDTFVKRHVGAGARLLDFGAGTGNLALTLAAHGYQVAATELSALQRDFIRFRVARHGLSDRVEVLNWWDDVPRARFDAVIAVDVLEHLRDPRATLEKQLFPALKPRGILIETSPFVINAANPMHHEDYGFIEHMTGAGFELMASGEDSTRVWARTGSTAAEDSAPSVS